jgi:hypothetical protein
MKDVSKEWRVTYEVRIGADTWHRAEIGPYSQKNNAWREFTKRRDMPDVYRNVAIQERTVESTVTYGDWLDYSEGNSRKGEVMEQLDEVKP